MEDPLIGPRLKSAPGLRHAALRAFGIAALGVFLSRVVPLPLPVLAALVLLGLALTRPTRGLSLYVALAGAAMAWSLARAPVRPDPAIYEQRSFKGIVVEEPVPAWPGDEPAPRRADRLVLELDRPERSRVILWLRDAAVRPRYGDELVVSAPIRRFDYPRNPGLPDRNEQLARRGFAGRASASGPRLRLSGHGRGRALIRRVIAPARARLRTRIARLFPDETGAVLMALLAGERQGIPGDTISLMRDSGLMHVLAVSGLHVGIIAGLVWFLLGLFGVRGWWRFLAGALAITAYIVFVGARPSAIRAGIMTLCAALAWTSQRRLEPGATLGTAGLALLLIDPNSLFEIGTQLSLAAAAGIIIAIIITDRMGSWWLRLVPKIRLSVRLSRLLRRILQTLIISFTAFTATAPFLLTAFGQVQLLAMPASPFAIMLTAFIVPLGGLAVLLSGIWFPLGLPLAETVRVLILGLTGLARFTAAQNWSILQPAGAGMLPVITAALVLFLLLHWQRRRAKLAAAVAALAGITIMVWTAALRPAADRAWFLDPGTGDAMIFENRAGRVLLLDAGIDGPGVVRDFLRTRGRNRVAVAIITHPHQDHYGGLLDLPDRVRIDYLLIPSRHGPPDYQQLLEKLETAGTEILYAAAGTELEFGGFRFRFIWPDESTRRLHAAGLLCHNDVSLVALAEHDGYRMLLTGDLDHPTLIAGREARAQLLKSPHHGSRVGNPPELFEEIAPELVVVMGRYPTPAGLETRLPETGIEYINTRRDGGFKMRWTGTRTVQLRDYRGRRFGPKRPGTRSPADRL